MAGCGNSEMTASYNKPPSRHDAPAARMLDVGRESEEASECGSGEDAELRCACGSLLARYVEGKVELKCRRCKRTMWIAVSGEGELGS
jgi:hypothetical protein